MTQPESGITAEEVWAEVNAIVASPAFAHSPRLGRLIVYLCTKALRGEAAQIKDYTIGVEVLERPASFNPATDASARVEVHRLRKRLREYYEQQGAGDSVRISVPVGQYAPAFAPREATAHSTDGQAASGGRGDEAGNTAVRGEHAPPATRGPIGRLLEKARRAVRGGRARGRADEGAARVQETPPATVVRLNCGQRQARGGRPGQQWLADQYYEGGELVELPRQHIARAFDPQMFQYARSGDFSYHIPLAAGTYQLHLHCVETTYGAGAPGGAGEFSRVFDVYANGRPILRNFDIVSDAGGPFIGDERVFKDITPDRDGMLHLKFGSRRERARVSAIEIVPAEPQRLNPIRIYIRESAHADANGHVWMPESYSSGGQIGQHPQEVAGARDQELYVAERYGHFSYAIPVDAGSYKLALHFAEKFFGRGNPAGQGGVGSRLFDVQCNGVALLKEFDIFKEAGANRACVKTFQGLKPNGQGKLLVTFSPIRDYASLYAVEVVDQGG
ncbi:MAG: malectin domain-containing carbohydrate-binding protein [Bryobacteraceae bacterium]